MPNVHSKLSSCGCCWDQKHTCTRDPTTKQCLKCIRYIRKSAGIIVLLAGPFLEIATRLSIESHVATLIDLSNYASFDIGLRIQTYSQEGIMLQPHDKILRFRLFGPFDTQSQQFKHQVDEIAFTILGAPLYSTNRCSNLIYTSTLVVGYAMLLCTTTFFAEKVAATWDENSGHYGSTPGSFHDWLKLCALGRFDDLINECLRAIRLADSSGDLISIREAYAACVILRYGIEYYRSNILVGNHRNIIILPTGFEDRLLNYSSIFRKELIHRLRLNCGKCHDWHLAYQGALRKIRRGTQTVSLSLTFNQTEFALPTAIELEITYDMIGTSDVYLLSPEVVALEPNPKFLHDIVLDTVEQLSAHDSSPSLPSSAKDDDEDMEEASVLAVSNLFPAMRPLLRLTAPE